MRNWLDVVVDWALARRAPTWTLVVALWIALILAMNGAKWAVGNFDADEHVQVTYDAAYLPLALLFYGLARNRARRAFDRFLPALAADAARVRNGAEFASLRGRTVVITTILGGAIGFASLVGDNTGSNRIGDTVLEKAVIGGLGLALAYGAYITVAAYGIVLVARISRLHRLASGVDLFRTGPAHAFAPVTASLSAFLIVGVSYSTLTDPATWATAVNSSVAGLTLAIALAVFAVPLLGMRAQLHDEKERLLDANRARMAATVARIEAAIDSGKDGLVAPMNDSVVALRAEGERVSKASTWPWEPSTLRGVVTSLLLPVATWGMTTGLSAVLHLGRSTP